MHYKQYIEEEIFPIYSKNDRGHDINHINSVISRSLQFSKYFDVFDNIVYIAAAYHDIGHHIDKDTHEQISADIFMEDEFMKSILSDDERKLVYDAIVDHRSSLEYIPRNDYGKILSSADRSFDFDNFIVRTHGYSLKHFSTYSYDEMVKRAYDHMCEKYMDKSSVKSYVLKDDELDLFLDRVSSFKNKYDEFKLVYNSIIEKNY